MLASLAIIGSLAGELWRQAGDDHLEHGMARPSTQRFAQGAILILLLALVRSAAEFYRLRATLGVEAGLHAFAPFVGGLLIGLVGLGVGLLLYFGGHFRTVVGLVVLTLGVLLVYKVRVIGI